MNTEKYKSIVVTKETYELLKNLSENNDRAISKELKRMIDYAMDMECYESNLDSERNSGGTYRLDRLLGDLKWFREYSANTPDRTKKYILDKEEIKAIDLLIKTIFDCGGKFE